MNFYHLILLDASGSMSCIRRTALTGCNETIQSIRSMQTKHPDQEHYLTLVSFNSDAITNLILDNVPVAEVKELNESDYRPDSCTPLYDAVGLSILRLEKKITEADSSVLVTIITDGLENASSEFDANMLKKLVEKKKQSNWTFAFIGANQDEVMEADKIGIHNSMSFEQSETGTRKMFRTFGSAMAKFCMSAPSMSAEERDASFFDNPEEQ